MYVNQTSNISCAAYSNINWHADNKPLPANFDVVETMNGEQYISTMIMSRVSHENAGVYYCSGSDVRSLQVSSEFDIQMYFGNTISTSI